MARNADLAPGFLVASPKLDESVFERSVILMIHHDEEGAMGFILNKPLDVDFGSILEMVEVKPDQIAKPCYEQSVFFGGPVRTEQLWVIMNGGVDEIPTNFEELDRSAEMQFYDEWALSGAVDSIESLATGHRDGEFRPLIGYSGWGPGQLEGEIEEGSWLVLDFDEDFVLKSKLETIWDDALARLGVDETIFAMMGKAGKA